MDSIRHLAPRPDAEVGIYYFWDFHSPLRVYMAQQWEKDTVTDFLTRWVSMGPLYADYGKYMVQRHPWLYLRYYMWPNFVKYYAPPAKFMGFYNLGEERVAPMTAQWFGWNDTKIHSYFKDRKINVTAPFSIISAIINILFVCCFIAFTWLDEFKHCAPHTRRVLWWTLLIWIGNMLFSALSAPIELRYQLFPLIITAIFLGLILYPLITAALLPGNDSKKSVSSHLDKAALIQV
jgi:hypothetical protein